MKVGVEIDCCEGNEESRRCLRDRCPIYVEAKWNIQKSWSYVGTGFGNLYGEPTHRQFLNEVAANIKKQKRS